MHPTYVYLIVNSENMRSNLLSSFGLLYFDRQYKRLADTELLRHMDSPDPARPGTSHGQGACRPGTRAAGVRGAVRLRSEGRRRHVRHHG